MGTAGRPCDLRVDQEGRRANGSLGFSGELTQAPQMPGALEEGGVGETQRGFPSRLLSACLGKTQVSPTPFRRSFVRKIRKESGFVGDPVLWPLPPSALLSRSPCGGEPVFPDPGVVKVARFAAGMEPASLRALGRKGAKGGFAKPVPTEGPAWLQRRGRRDSPPVIIAPKFLGSSSTGRFVRRTALFR